MTESSMGIEFSEEDQELIREFTEEAFEQLDGVEGDLLSIEAGEDDEEGTLVNKIFRAVHSIKGAAGFFGLNNVTELAHVMENVLGLVREGKAEPSPELIGPLLEGADKLVSMLNNLEQSNELDISTVMEALKKMYASCLEHIEDQIGTPTKEQEENTPGATVQETDSTVEPPPDPVEQPAQPAVSEPKKDKKESHSAQDSKSEGSIRVKLPLLDRLMTLAGELVLTRNQLVDSVSNNLTNVPEVTHNINLITTDLQDAIMSTRMQSVGGIFGKFRRVVRDVSRNLGKKIDLVLEGEDVELDKTIIEALNDPLTHLIRNAADHGVESPEVRAAAGKPEVGTLRLGAYHKAGHVVLEIEDDGKGIDTQKLRSKVLAEGKYTAEQLDAMNEQAIIKLIFRPGFSMAEKVTEISGRGVGMDVVHSNFKKIGGIVDISSRVGEGTCIRVKLPLTLTIIPCLMVSEESEHFAIPQSNLVELHRISARDVGKKVKRIGEYDVMQLRGELLPLARLRNVLGMPNSTYSTRESIDCFPDRRTTIPDRRSDSPETVESVEHDRRSGRDRRQRADSAVNIAIVAAGNFHFGLIVDRLQDSAEIVVKPLDSYLKECENYAGATILGNGRTALILDIASISASIGIEESQERTFSEVDNVTAQSTGDELSILVVENAINSRCAIPLGLVERVEKTERNALSFINGRRTMKYRGKSLLLLAIEDAIDVPPISEVDELYVVVFKKSGMELGLLVSNLVDIVNSQSSIDETIHKKPGVHGSFIVDDHITLLLDIQTMTTLAFPELANTTALQNDDQEEKRFVLVVEDSEFFMKQIAECVEEFGYPTLRASDGQEALELLDHRGDEVDLILTDIEMPNLDGFEMTRRIRQDPRYQNVPIIAVTSLIGTAAETRGMEVGINDYLVKLDREQILERTQFYIGRGQSA
ncbi:MAG: hybrid sensor histidine kinase/response regulator [Proteobacteria bacterium]|nr:hybrid sensor histidine kinase/response regulator [Pseudomonadota bacterium]